MAETNNYKSRRQILDILKQEGEKTAEELGERLGVTAMAVRQHLYDLEAESLVRHEARPAGRGRPRKWWCLTPAADRFFPDGHAELTTGLLGAMREAFGDEGLERLLAARRAGLIETYAKVVAPHDALENRLAALAAERSREGYMAEVMPHPQGGWLLVENHCPICTAASACSGLCRIELEAFRAVLGQSTQVAREDHILAGARRCAYRVVGDD
ncbi:helix-turn-helix transcriptional regulator [Limibacillus halophilus]|uniref:Putative ArsR family transcriptional regulator n=1 Tax=Limibacillus halophilus TaxID=1579333 RepID=A0A839SUG5_9PROT|nr:metalloregulator ArsR/SmtB family transcription factor [Limibacillus halophilus]MBB3066457.1 putative ArsR family transcriptional regulator [Limibacillus halophilus]